MNPIQLFDPDTRACTYILFDVDTREALLIDPVEAQCSRDLATLREYGLTAVWAVATHAQADPLHRAGLLAERTGAQTATTPLRHGDALAFGAHRVHVWRTPGHAAGCMGFVWHDGATTHLFTGEALHLSPAAVPLAGADGTALPDDTVLWPGLGSQGRTHTTLGQEKATHARLVAQPAQGYAGDVSPPLAWAWVQAGEAVLVDVRTDAEREWVGSVPGATPLAWKQWPGMVPNAAFDAGIAQAAAGGQKLVLLCRSGVRSIAAAKRATELGLTAYNILEGFEGDPNADAHRGHKGGWRFHGLPWRQN